MDLHELTNKASKDKVIAYLEAKNLYEIVGEFKGNEIDGQDFFELELVDIYQMIPHFKLRKQFISAWSAVTLMEKSNSVVTPLHRSPRKLSKPCQPNSSEPSVRPSNKMSSVKVLNFKTPDKVSHDKDITTGKMLYFQIPERWEPCVERGLSRKCLEPNEASALVRQLATTLLAHHPRPGISEQTHASLLLVQKYPFLKGSFKEGHQYWAKKLDERIWNLRRRAARHEREEAKKAGVPSAKGKPGRKKKGSLNVPDIPEGETKVTLEQQKQELLRKWRSGKRDIPGTKVLMDNTFPMRRRSILEEDARVWAVLGGYTCLKDEKAIEMKNELGRILNEENVGKTMREIWEAKKPQVLGAMKKSKIACVQSSLSDLEECDAGLEREMENRCMFASLPHELGEKTSHKHVTGELFWEIVTSGSAEDLKSKIATCTTPKLISTGTVMGVDSLILAAEGMVVINFKQVNILNAVLSLLASYYVFNAHYPKGHSCGQTKNVYIFLEHILIKKGKCSTLLPIGVENFVKKLSQI